MSDSLSAIKYTVRRSARARKFRLLVYTDGRVVGVLPSGVAEWRLHAFVRDRQEWIKRKLGEFEARSPKTVLPSSKKEFEAKRQAAKGKIEARVSELSQRYGFSFSRLSVRDQRSRWGSCSERGNLSFNYRLAELPGELMDYVIVHELCHLRVFNHSRAFWEEIEKIIPAYRSFRKSLRNYVIR